MLLVAALRKPLYIAPPGPVTEKPCTKCGAVLPLETGYYRDRRKRDGRASQCKHCDRAYATGYYRENGEKVRGKVAERTAKIKAAAR